MNVFIWEASQGDGRRQEPTLPPLKPFQTSYPKHPVYQCPGDGGGGGGGGGSAQEGVRGA